MNPDPPESKLLTTVTSLPAERDSGLTPPRSTEPISPDLAEVKTQTLEHAGSDTNIQFNCAVQSAAFGRYELQGVLGEGGMGVVYKAFDSQLKRTVALKKIALRAVSSPQNAERFRTEAQAAAQFDHRHIVQIHDVGQHNGEHYFTMPLLTGGTLAEKRELLSHDRRKAVEYTIKVARAMDYAHRKGVIHRDLKPHNILLDENAEPRVADFGLAKVIGSDAQWNERGRRLGTPGYMAPEQVRGDTEQVGPAGDIWSLGIILYEFLTGRRPFAATDRESLTYQICDVEPPPLTELAPGLPPDLERIVLKCLRKKPAERYRSAGEMADDLEQWLRRETGPAPPRQRWYVELAAAALIALPLLIALLFAAAKQFANHGQRNGVLSLAPPAEPSLDDGLRLRDRLVKGERLVLIDDSGGPIWWRYRTERNRPPLNVLPGEYLRVLGSGPFLLELLPDVKGTNFRLRAKIQHVAGIDGLVGIYFGHHEIISGPGEGHWHWVVRFATLGMLAYQSDLASVFFRADPKLNQQADRNIDSDKKRVPPGDQARWHDLLIEVSTSGVTVVLDKDVTWKRTRAEMLERGRPLQLPAAAGPAVFPLPPPEHAPPLDGFGGLGLYIKRGEARFRNVIIEPLPNPPPGPQKEHS